MKISLTSSGETVPKAMWAPKVGDRAAERLAIGADGVGIQLRSGQELLHRLVHLRVGQQRIDGSGHPETPSPM
ncbi:hypothetical protein ACTMTI_53380 [Nonomuraea sp. H19]|uniref:hypothetical protein n=1 Tax=Nonomuraea sp. H19 TaxID=3452206 RepID=UPI003F8C41B1